jgi:hypothetical protein
MEANEKNLSFTQLFDQSTTKTKPLNFAELDHIAGGQAFDNQALSEIKIKHYYY